MNAPTKGAQKRYDSIIVEPDIDSRMRLKQAAASVYHFGKVIQTNNPEETMGKLTGTEQWDVIFISHRFDQAQIADFIKKGKSSAGGQDTAYILILKAKDQASSTVAANVMVGADGFLFEPYSVDQLVEITQLAARVRLERSETREKAAMSLLVSDVINQVDQVACLLACKVDLNKCMKKLREMCTVFKTLDDSRKAVYYDCAIKQFEEAKVPVNNFQAKQYGGVSSRIKKKMEAKLIAELEKAPEEAPK